MNLVVHRVARSVEPAGEASLAQPGAVRDVSRSAVLPRFGFVEALSKFAHNKSPAVVNRAPVVRRNNMSKCASVLI